MSVRFRRVVPSNEEAMDCNNTKAKANKIWMKAKDGLETLGSLVRTYLMFLGSTEIFYG